MKKYLPPLLMFVIAMFVLAPSWAQAGSGFYIGGDIGANFSKAVEFEGASNDTWSQCDEYLNPDFDTDGGCTAEQQKWASDSFVQDWWSDFDGGQGILAGATVGYSFANQNPNSPLAGFRVEMEYFYRESMHDQNSQITRASGITRFKIDAGEFVEGGPTEYLGSITSHNIFGNVYYDFANTSRFTPYIGIGGGIGVTNATWGSNWTRTLDEAGLRQGFLDLANNSDINLAPSGTAAEDMARRAALRNLAQDQEYIRNLAGSSTVAHTTLSDTLWGLQVLFGVDYAMTETMSLGLKGRWVKFSSFEDNLVWNPLRGHVPYVRMDADGNPTGPMIRGRMETDDIEFFGISVNLKYHF